MSEVTHRRGGTAGARCMTPSTRELTIREVLAEIGVSKAPADLHSGIPALDQSWTGSSPAETWLVNACLKARRPDLLAAMLNQHGAKRLIGIRDGAEFVADLLRDCPSLADVEFSGAPISDDAARLLVLAFHECRGLTSLTLRNCEMSNDALGTIADGLSEMHRLQSFRIETHSGAGLGALGAGIARSTLTSFALDVRDLTEEEAATFGRSLQGNRTLTMLALHATSSRALVSMLEALAPAVAPVVDGVAQGVAEDFCALPRLVGMDLRADATLSDAFCKWLSRWIRTHHVLASVRVRPGIQASVPSVAKLCAAIDRHSVKIDFDARRVPKPLLQFSKLLPYRQLIVPEDAMRIAALALLRKSKLWRGLPGELAQEIASTLVGNGSLRELWRLRGLMGVRKKKMREPATLARSTLHCKRFATGWGRRDSPDRPDLGAFDHYWRLQLSGIELGESDALLSREWALGSKTGSELARAHVFYGELMEIGRRLVSEHETLVRWWIGEGDGAAALNSIQRLAREHGLDDEREGGELSRRLTLGEMRYQRRNASAHLTRSMFAIVFALLTADHFFDVAMRQLFDQDSAYGIGSPFPLEAAQDQRKWASGWILLPLVAVIVVIYMIKVEWVDAVTRRLRLPQI